MRIGNWQIVVILFLLIFISLILSFFDFNLGIYQPSELGILQVIVLAVFLILLGRFKYYLWVHQTEEDVQRQTYHQRF